MRFCYNCGAEIEEGSKFCVECGAELGLVDVEENDAKTELIASAKRISVAHNDVEEHQETELRAKKQREADTREAERHEADMREAQRRESEMREAVRHEADMREAQRREAERIRLEKLDKETKLRAAENKRIVAAKKKKNKAIAAAVLTVIAIAAVCVSLIYIKKYTAKSDKKSDKAQKENSTYHIVNNLNDTTEISTEITTADSSQTTEESTRTLINGKEYLDVESLPDYFEGNLTLDQIGLVLEGISDAIYKGNTTREELFNTIIDHFEWFPLPGVISTETHEVVDKNYYDYLEYSYNDIKKMLLIVLDDDEFDLYAYNRNGKTPGCIIDKDKDIFRIQGYDYIEGENIYEDKYPQYFYIENGNYYIETYGDVYSLYECSNGKMKVTFWSDSYSDNTDTSISDNQNGNEKSSIKIEDLPKYFNGNLTLEQLGLAFVCLNNVHNCFYYGIEEIIEPRSVPSEMDILDYMFAYMIRSEIPGMRCDDTIGGDGEKFTRVYSYNEIKDLYGLIFSNDKFDELINSSQHAGIDSIDREQDTITVWGYYIGEFMQDYSFYKPKNAYIENNLLYIEAGNATFVAEINSDGYYRIDYNKCVFGE